MALVKQVTRKECTVEELIAGLTEKQLATARILYRQRIIGQKPSDKFTYDLLVEIRDNS